MPSLIARSGPRAGERMELVGPVTFGRDPGHSVHLADDEVSRLHATIRPEGDAVVIEDHGSTNGTFVDDRRITGTVTLTGGEMIAIGESRFEVELLREEAALSSATKVATRPTRVADTRLSSRPGRRARTAVTVASPSATSALPSVTASVPATPVEPPVAPPFGTFAVAPSRPARGIATRELVPSLVSLAAIVATALGLLAYFAGRGF